MFCNQLLIDDNSVDSGFEKSYETVDHSCVKKLYFDDCVKSGNSKKLSKKRSESFDDFETPDIFNEHFTNIITSTPIKNDVIKIKRKYAQGSARITRSQSPTKILKIRKHRRIKANVRERNRMHSLNEALGKIHNLFIKHFLINLLICSRTSSYNSSNIS